MAAAAGTLCTAVGSTSVCPAGVSDPIKATLMVSTIIGSLLMLTGLRWYFFDES